MLCPVTAAADVSSIPISSQCFINSPSRYVSVSQRPSPLAQHGLSARTPSGMAQAASEYAGFRRPAVSFWLLALAVVPPHHPENRSQSPAPGCPLLRGPPRQPRGFSLVLRNAPA